MIRIPIISVITTISCHSGGMQDPNRKCSLRSRSIRGQLGFHYDTDGEDRISDYRNPKAIERDKRKQYDMPYQGETSKHQRDCKNLH